MSGARRMLSRQWVSIPGGSCDIRMGYGALEQGSDLLKASVGRPRLCVAVVPRDMGEPMRTTLARQLAASGFEVRWHEVDERRAATLDESMRLANFLASEALTRDDLCCALGETGVLSLASYVCDCWCDGMSLVAIPMSAPALLEGALNPCGLEVAGFAGMVSVRPTARHVLLDYDLVCRPLDDEANRLTRVLMVAAAMCGSERDFSTLWDGMDELMTGDDEQFVSHVLESAKTRGRILSSTAAAIRQSIAYGEDFARAVDLLVAGDVPRSVLLAEGMRFCARLAVGMGKLSIDDMLAQDELLEAAGIGVASCNVDAHRLCDALKCEHLLRSNRFMMLVPFALGRVRLATVDDELLLEHARAWCAAHA